MRRLFYALPVVLAVATAAAELPPDVWFSPCSDPVATCVRPAAAHTQKESCSGCSSQPAPTSEPRRLHPVADTTRETLDRWEEASRAFYPVTEAERFRLRVENGDLTGQQLELVCALKQPIRSSDLVQRYHWATLSRQGDIATLVAVPKDRLERLFYDRFVVDIDTELGRPVDVRFGSVFTEGGGAVHQVISIRPWLDQSQLDIQLVGLEATDGAMQLIRTADATEETMPMPPQDSALLTPPPAPLSFDCVEP